MEKNHSHTYSFFGQKVGLIFQSANQNKPFIFFQFIKKKDSGDWEKPSKGEGKVIKFSLEEIIMILEVLNKRISSWGSYHTFKNDSTQISFKWQEENGKNLWINVNEYSKLLKFAQLEIFKRLLEHVLSEKIRFATIPKRNYKEDRVDERRNQEKELYIKEERSVNRVQEDSDNKTSLDDSKNITEIEGSIKAKTPKAILIKFNESSEQWVPKSLIKSQFVDSKEISQKFLIDTWILKKNQIIA
jgi:hypothetical protein